MAKRREARHIFFPWERRGGLLRRIRIDQAGPVLVVAAAAFVVALVGMHERRTSGVRRTRATILNTRSAVDTYMSDHDGGCPPAGLQSLGTYGAAAARDAWGKELRLRCPGAEHGRY